jgi:hypothetical protein
MATAPVSERNARLATGLSRCAHPGREAEDDGNIVHSECHFVASGKQRSRACNMLQYLATQPFLSPILLSDDEKISCRTEKIDLNHQSVALFCRECPSQLSRSWLAPTEFQPRPFAPGANRSSSSHALSSGVTVSARRNTYATNSSSINVSRMRRRGRTDRTSQKCSYSNNELGGHDDNQPVHQE